MDKAIVVVDEIYDFIYGGALECGHSEEAVAATKELIQKHKSSPSLFVCDHHPVDHCSFVEQGGPWPAHCVAGTHGAQIHESLLPYVMEELVFYKGCDPAAEQYSGFDGRNEAGQSLGEVLETLGIEHVYIAGIATEYCVLNTATDLLKAGFKVSLVEDCLGWVDPAAHTSALAAMKSSGIQII